MDCNRSILAPLLKVLPEELLVGGDILLDRHGKPGVVEELPVVDVLAAHVARPGTAAQALRPDLAVVPAPRVDEAVGHVAFHPAHFGLDGELLHPFHPLGVDGGGVADPGEVKDLVEPVDHFVEVVPFPDGEDEAQLLAGEAVLGADLLANDHQELRSLRRLDPRRLGNDGNKAPDDVAVDRLPVGPQGFAQLFPLLGAAEVAALLLQGVQNGS